MSVSLPKNQLMKIVMILSILIIPLLFSLTQQQQTAFATSDQQVTVTASSLHVRDLASMKGKIIGFVHKGDTFNVLKTSQDWDQIRLLNNQFGWINTHYVKDSMSSISLTAVPKVNGLNVHQAADLNSKIISHLSLGDTVSVLDKNGNLVNIQSLNGPGWVTSQLVDMNPISSTNTQPTVQVGTVTVPALNIRQHPSLDSVILGDLYKGVTVKIQSEQNHWANITLSSGGSAWVYKDYLKVATQHPLNTQLTSKKKTVQATSDQKSKAQQTSSSTNNKRTIQSVGSPIMPVNEAILKGKTIVLDPGHGGQDVGTTSVSGTYEKTLTLETAKLVQQKLEAAGAHVIMTRSDDSTVSLQARAVLSNKLHADAFISFHYNWSSIPSIRGTTSFYYNKNRDEALASDILSGVTQATGLTSRGARFDNLHVLRNNTQPCTLIELGFVSNRIEDQIVETSTYREEVAQGVYTGLIHYFTALSSN